MIYLLTAIFAVIIVGFIVAEYREYIREEKDAKERMNLKKKYRRDDNNETY